MMPTANEGHRDRQDEGAGGAPEEGMGVAPASPTDEGAGGRKGTEEEDWGDKRKSDDSPGSTETI